MEVAFQRMVETTAEEMKNHSDDENKVNKEVDNHAKPVDNQEREEETAEEGDNIYRII